MSLIGSCACCHFIIKAKTLAVEIGPKMTSAFAHIVSEREEASKKGAYALYFKTRKILANLFRSFIAGSRFRSVDSHSLCRSRLLSTNDLRRRSVKDCGPTAFSREQCQRPWEFRIPLSICKGSAKPLSFLGNGSYICLLNSRKTTLNYMES